VGWEEETVMKGKITIIVVLMLTGMAVSATMIMAHHPTGVITIDESKNKKAPVAFPHGEHAEDIVCVTCHHTSEGEKVEEKCFDCHGQDPDAPDPSVSSLKDNPFHSLCRGCHKDKGVGPTSCNDCHRE
jgi:hypothetical protein